MNYSIQLKKKGDTALIVVYRITNNKLTCLGATEQINTLNTLIGDDFRNMKIDDIKYLSDEIGKQLETMPLGEITNELKLQDAV